MLTNKNQTRVSISGLTYNNLIEDAYNALKDSDEFKNNFTSFTSNSAERMIVELYAYVASQLANRMDQMGNELFIDTASINGLTRLMKLVGAKLDFPAAAEVEVEVSTSSVTDDLLFSSGINTSDTELNYTSNSFKYVKANNGTVWEFIKKDIGEDGEYTHPYYFKTPSQKYILQQGRTQAKSDYVINSTEIDILQLPDTSVIKNSVRIYYKDKVLKEGTEDTYEIKEMKRVENFFTVDALTATTGVYTVRNMGDGKLELCIKPYYNAEDNISDIGKGLLIMYRTISGGTAEDGNISIGNISSEENFTRLSGGQGVGIGLLSITNINGGSGGVNELTTDEIRNTVIQEVRNTKIAITEEDYEYLLPKYDKSIELIKCYGEKDDETADLSETYGYYVNPLNIWLIILKYSQEFSEAYMNDVGGLTSRINDIAFSTLDINPRFNEKYQINSAYINQLFRSADLEDYFDQASHRYTFPLNQKGTDLLKQKGCLITVTNYPYIESAESSRRGIHAFQRYNGTAINITWNELLNLESATRGDAYLVTDIDKNDEIDSRWLCTESFDSVLPESEFDAHWEKVDFVYVYDNLVSADDEDRLWIQQSSDDSSVYYPVYSNLPYSFSGNLDVFKNTDYWDDDNDKIKIPAGERVIIYINGQPIIIDTITSSTGLEFSLEELCDYINSKIDPSANIIFLKRNVPGDLSTQIESNEEYTAEETSAFIEIEGVPTQITYDPTGVVTYQDFIDRINESLEVAHLDDKVLAISVIANDCLNVALISGLSFTYKDSDTAGQSAIYTYLLNNDPPAEWPLTSSAFKLDADQAAEWARYLSTDEDIAFIGEDGLIHIGFGVNGEASLEITGSASSVELISLFKRFFGLSATTSDKITKYQRRILDIAYSETKSDLIITTTSPDDLLKKDIYINIFGPRNGEIKLGEYYEKIEDYLPDVPDVVLNLLRRGPIKHLYSTSYITSDTSDIADRYGSSYKIKFSTGLIEEQTFNQLSSGNSPAEVFTRSEVNTSFANYDVGSKFLVKVDNVEYNGAGNFDLVINGETVTRTVPALNGYAEFDLSWFNGSSMLTFIQSIVNTFENQGNEQTSLLIYSPTVDNTLRLYTTSSSFYSSIDFGDTPLTVLYSLFGINSSTVYSKEGQIIAKEIDYKIFSMTDSLAVGNSIYIKVVPTSGGAAQEANVLIGYNLQNFINNLAASAVGQYVIISDLRLVFLQLTNGASIQVKIKWNSKTEYEIWKGMFTPDTWANFEIIEGDETAGTASCIFINDGDYYIRYDGNDYYLVVENPDAFPFGDIYFHMYEDYSNDHIVEETDNFVKYTDEYVWNNLMTKKRVMLTEHVYKQPRFIPFDLALICDIPNTETFSSTNYINEISSFLRTEYGLYSNNIGEEILSEDIKLKVKERFPKIRNVYVEYMGYNLTNEATNKKEDGLKTEFNQKHILASTETTEDMVLDETTSIIIRQVVVKHGLKLTLRYVA